MELQQNLLSWYLQNQRKLPFRETTDPYKIWVSEIMLQQTRIDTVIPYYNKFMKTFPTIRALAEAQEEDVFKLWEGLGYYSRARNILKCAKVIVNKYKGKFPTEYKEVLKLPGIGPYTAGAVLSIAYNLKYPAVDGNVMRVISRIYNIEDDIAIPKTRNIFEDKVQSILPEDVRHFNQGLMELGALICTPRNPKCDSCPVTGYCKAYKLSLQEKLPIKSNKITNKKFHVAVGIIKDGEKFLLIKNNKGLLSGLWGFPVVEDKTEEKALRRLLNLIINDYGFKVNHYYEQGKVKHIFTHKTWRMIAYVFEIENFEGELSEYDFTPIWTTKDNINDYGISTAFKKILSLMIHSDE